MYKEKKRYIVQNILIIVSTQKHGKNDTNISYSAHNSIMLEIVWKRTAKKLAMKVEIILNKKCLKQRIY